MKKIDINKITVTALFIALGIIVPMLFHSIYMFGKIFLPMHITVILCAIICGPYLGSLCALVTVLISSLLTGMPPLYPVAIIMCFELVVYALVSGVAIRFFNTKVNKISALYISLIIAMIAGRLVLGVASVVFLGILENTYTFNAFITSAFVTALPGIVIQLVLIPSLVILIEKTRLVKV